MESTLNYTKFYIKGKSSDKEENKKLPLFEFCLSLVFVLYYLLPAINTTVPILVAVIVAAGYGLLLWLKNAQDAKYILTLLISAFVLSCLYCFLTDTATISQSVDHYVLKRIISKFSQYFMSFFPVVMFLRIRQKASKSQMKCFVLLMLLLVAYVLVNTTIELMTNENATRDWSEFAEQSENNVGTYAYVYAVPIIVSILPVLFLKWKKGWQKILLLGVTMFLLVFLLLAQYTLALLIGLIGFLLQININIKKPKKKYYFWFGLILLLLCSPLLLDLLAKYVPSKQMAIRLKEVAAFFSSGDISGYNLSSRLELYGKTILAFFQSPIIGNRSLGFDGHSTFLSVFADIGIFGGILFVYLYALAKKQIDNKLELKRKIFLPVFVSLILMGLTNPIHSAMPLSFVVWLLIPMLLILPERKKEEKKHEKTLGN